LIEISWQEDDLAINIFNKFRFSIYLNYWSLETAMNNYVIHLNEEQVRIISRACELFARVHTGQLTPIAEEFFHKTTPILHSLQDGLRRLEPLITGMPPHASLGLTNPEVPDKARVAYDIHQVIRYIISWDNNPDGGITVNFDRPFKTSDQPNIKMDKE
jgi:hypothetical protein